MVLLTKTNILGSDSIIIGYNLQKYIADDVTAEIKASTYVFFSDSNIAPLHLQPLLDAFENALSTTPLQNDAPRILSYIIPPGEVSKSRRQKAQCEGFLLSNACTRDTCILALGGGVIGDLVGFVAATFMRGVPFVQIPTSLLAMVDSSIGGKTAIDTPHGKNLVGAFWQPRRIYMDLEYLKSLPKRELSNGLAEVIKTAAFWSEKDFELLESNVEKIKGMTDPQLLQEVILSSVRVKAHVVTIDERESGLRGLLNFGHTIGHAIEGLLSPEMLHGECVSIGMVKEAEVARRMGHLNQVAVGRLIRCLQAYDLPVSLDEKRVCDLTKGKVCLLEDLMHIMKVDKKNEGEKKRIVILTAIGKTLEQKPSFVSDSVIRKVLAPAALVVPCSDSNLFQQTRDVTLTTPGSKSISNRALIFASLGEGVCRVRGLLHSDDTQVMLDALQQLGGSSYAWEDDGNTLVVTGGWGKLRIPDNEIYLGNAGTAARFLTTVCTLVPEPSTSNSSGKHATILTGNPRMKQRPIGPLVNALRENGQRIRYLESEACLPLEITPTPGGLSGGEICLAASISSQYVSSILLCAPYARAPVTLKLVGGAVVSQPYIDMTIALMHSFGIEVERLGENTYRIPQGVYRNPSEFVVESDASSATYPLAVAAITGTKVTVPNIGSSSLQGDAQFAVLVLKPMGCIVTQTETSTTVQGPPLGKLKPLPHIDMEPMTDAFLTASVLAAVACNTPSGAERITRITGIANQRVKECNRIAAMVHELGKFGVHASELPDGIEIHARPIQELQPPVDGVECYDDHRIAMSFSVLGCVAPVGTLIREKKCVEKTWPGWWDELERHLAVDTCGVDLVKKCKPQDTSRGSSKSITKTHMSSSASVVFIGMRGAGKTHLGQAAAQQLGWKFIDIDQHFELSLGMPVKQYVSENGWDAFRLNETRFLAEILSQNATHTVIACGGGIVETPDARQLLGYYSSRSDGRVVHIRRDLHEIEKYLATDPTRPDYGENFMQVWKRREPWYRQCSTYEFVAFPNLATGLATGEDWASVESDLKQFMNHVLSPPSAVPCNSFFLSLTVPNIKNLIPYLEEVSFGANALELRVDLLVDPSSSSGIPSDDFVRGQIGILRRYSSLPIIFTVRTRSQGGQFPDNEAERMFELLRNSVGWGCEYVDIEITASDDALSCLVKEKAHSLIIASWHDIKGDFKWTSSRARQIAARAAQFGDVVKMVGSAKSLQDNFDLFAFAHSGCEKLEGVTSHHGDDDAEVAPIDRIIDIGDGVKRSVIAINMGTAGQLSRCLNQTLTPVTHPKLPVKAAPGQLSIREINAARHLLGVVPACQHYLFGTPIAKSPSPALHNAGFAVLGLPHQYSLHETATVDVLAEVMRSAGFNGASVTIPHKLDIIPLLDSITPCATTIGAVNTVIVNGSGENRRLVGDNTDWLGIRGCIVRNLSATKGQIGSALVIGAGGTARAALYALQDLGTEVIYIYNRTFKKANALAKEFSPNVVAVENLLPSSLMSKDGLLPSVIVATIPATGQTDLQQSFLGLFAACAERSVVGVAVELAYRPRTTPFLASARKIKWKCVEGVDVLVEQGVHQFERWTGFNAPRRVMEEAVAQKYQEKEE